ncbi:MAG: glycosyltransferase [Egibacteraceae bacterium]
MPNRSRSWSRKKGSPRLRSAPPTVTVIIPAHNEAESITETVRSCLEQTYKPQRVLVMADACSDDTAELAREAGAEVIEVDFKCKSLCQRAALELVTTDIVVGLDADSTFSPNAIALMVVDLHKGYDATCTTVLPKQEKGLFPRSRALNYAVACRWWRFIEKGLGRLQCISGCGYAMRVKTLRDAGGFAVDAISEDRLTTWDLYAHGARITYTPAALVYTQEPETLKTYYKQLKPMVGELVSGSEHPQEATRQAQRPPDRAGDPVGHHHRSGDLFGFSLWALRAWRGPHITSLACGENPVHRGCRDPSSGDQKDAALHRP